MIASSRRLCNLKAPSFLTCSTLLHFFSTQPPSFGVAFDIDGVILLRDTAIGESSSALRRLYDQSGDLRIPYVFLTNGGGISEAKRAAELGSLLGLTILPSQVIQGHTPFKGLVKRYENRLIVSVGKGEPALVMSEYGFKNVVSIDDYAASFDGIDPLSRYKTWNSRKMNMNQRGEVCSQKVEAVFVVSDSVDWSRDIQVLCDILRTGGHPGGDDDVDQPGLFLANDDLEYQSVFPYERLGMGAFRIALEAVFNRVNSKPLDYTSFGKPKAFVFKNAEVELMRMASSMNDGFGLRTFYMVGDNPKVDVRGALQIGRPWYSILTRTGVFKGATNHHSFPADSVVDDVSDAVDLILTRESYQ